jgi:hypothetical protein
VRDSAEQERAASTPLDAARLRLTRWRTLTAPLIVSDPMPRGPSLRDRLDKATSQTALIPLNQYINSALKTLFEPAGVRALVESDVISRRATRNVAMNKILVAMMAGAAATPAFADHVPGHADDTVPGFEDSYDNRGQCESALAQARNERRKNTDALGWAYEELSGAEYNRESMRTTECRQNEDGTWYVFFDADRVGA